MYIYYYRPSSKETAFNLIINGRMNELIHGWDRINYVTPEIYDLLTKMLTKESKRITISQIKRHPWLR